MINKYSVMLYEIISPMSIKSIASPLKYLITKHIQQKRKYVQNMNVEIMYEDILDKNTVRYNVLDSFFKKVLKNVLQTYFNHGILFLVVKTAKSSANKNEMKHKIIFQKNVVDRKASYTV